VPRLCGRPRGHNAWRETSAQAQEEQDRQWWPSWLLYPMSSTHNESRWAACPLPGVPGAFAALSINAGASWEICDLVGRAGRSCQSPLGASGAWPRYLIRGSSLVRWPERLRMCIRRCPLHQSTGLHVLLLGSSPLRRRPPPQVPSNIHNLLSGVRALNPATADSLLRSRGVNCALEPHLTEQLWEYLGYRKKK